MNTSIDTQFATAGVRRSINIGTTPVSGLPDHRVIVNLNLLSWMLRTFALSAKLDGGSQLFGPYNIRGRDLHVHYDLRRRRGRSSH